jgi:hypothetical protein
MFVPGLPANRNSRPSTSVHDQKVDRIDVAWADIGLKRPVGPAI